MECNGFSKNIDKLKQIIRVGQIVPCDIVKVINDRDILIKVYGVVILAYTNLKFITGDKAYLRIDQLKGQLRFKLISANEYETIKNKGIDYTI